MNDPENLESIFLLEDGWVLRDFPPEETLPDLGGALYLYRCPKIPNYVAQSGRYVEKIRFVVYHSQGYGKEDRKPVIVSQMGGKILFGYAYL